jgi:tRNA-binding protein
MALKPSINGTREAAGSVVMREGLGAREDRVKRRAPRLTARVRAATRNAPQRQKAPAMTAANRPPTISFDDFLKVDIRLGTVRSAEPFPQARKPAYRLTIDFGPAIGVKKSSAQITRHYRPEDLVGRRVAAVVNFPPSQIGPFLSEVLTLGFPDADGEVVLIGPDRPAPDGGRLF